MARITFVYPDFESLAVEYLMAVCLRDGHTVDLVFYTAEDAYTSLKKRTPSFADIAKKIVDTRPHFVAFSCVTNNYRVQLECARALKKIMPQVITVFGGIHPTAVPEIVLKEAAVDSVAIGEAEKSFSDFLKECESGGEYALPRRPIKGVIYKSGGEVIGDLKEGELSDLNALPFPYKRPLYSQFRSFSQEYFIMASRGCPYSCAYCFHSHLRNLRGRSLIRRRNVDNVIAEIAQARRDHPLKYIYFIDDCFVSDRDWIIKFCEVYKKEIHLPFSCCAIPQYLNKEKVEALSSAGCYRMQIGIQTLNKELCEKVLQRHFDKGSTSEAIRMLKDAGIFVQVDHMLGIPGDSLQIEEESVLFYNEFRPNIVSSFWLTYYPKIAVIETAKQKGLLSECDVEKINQGYMPEESLHSGGSMKDPRPYYGICLLLTYLPLLPSWLVRFLIHRKLYRRFSSKNPIVFIGFARFILSFHRRNFVDQGYIRRFLNKRGSLD